MNGLRVAIALLPALALGCSLDSAGGGSPATLGNPTETTSAGETTGGADATGGSGQVIEGPRKRFIEIESGAVAGLAGAPVLVLLDSERIEYEATLQGGSDLRFVSADELETLAHEIEVWDPQGQSAIWVRVPDDAPDGFWMYYGDDLPAAAPNPTQVWGSQYLAVWHMLERDSSMVPDATVSAHDATLVGSGAPVYAEGVVGRSLVFSGGDDHAEAPTLAPAITGAVTVEAWVRMQSLDPTENRLIVSKRDSYQLRALEPGLAQPRAAVRLEAGIEVEAGPPSSLPTDDWTYLVATYDSVMRILSVYIDGRRVALAQPDIPGGQSPLIAASEFPLLIGRRLNARLDEVRVSNVVRSEQYISAQFEALQDEALHFGPPEPR